MAQQGALHLQRSGRRQLHPGRKGVLGEAQDQELVLQLVAVLADEADESFQIRYEVPGSALSH